MKTRRALLGLGYIAALFAIVPYVDGPWAPWVVALISIAFALAFTSSAGGSAVVGLSLVFIATTFFPIVVLVAIGIPHYPSLSALLQSYVSTSFEHNQLLGFEVILPTVITGLALFVGGRMRSNNTLDSDARKSGARPSP